MRQDWVVIEAGEKRRVRVSNGGDSFAIEFLDEGRTLRLDQARWRPGDPTFAGVLDGRAFTARVRPAAEGFVIRHRAAQAPVLVLTPRSAELHERLPPKTPADTSKMVLSPMPGLVVSIDVAAGQEVRSGQPVAVIEAMKMQNIIRAERDGTVKAVNASAGDSVAADEVLVEFA
jgi:propionyl-CoA carboxylase alpha chain